MVRNKVKHKCNLQLWAANAQVIKTRQLAIELHGLVTCKYSMAHRVCNCPKGFICLSFVASTGINKKQHIFSCFKLQQQQKTLADIWFLVFGF